MSRRPEQEPVETKGLREGTKLDHPAYGMIAASHTSGSTTLFGTDFEHHHYVTVRIHPATLYREIMHDVYEARNIPYIEVAMSESQWATFVSRPNTGQGVQCTVLLADGEEKPRIPLRRSTDVHASDFKARVAEVVASVQRTREAVGAELGGLSGKKRDAALAHLARLEQDLKSNLPWYVEVLEKQMHQTVESAKVEVGAYINHAITRAGLTALGVPTEAPFAMLTEGSPLPTPTDEEAR